MALNLSMTSCNLIRELGPGQDPSAPKKRHSSLMVGAAGDADASSDTPFLPKKLKFLHGDETKGLNKIDENGKGAIMFSLAAADQPLVDKINTFNDDRLESFKMYGPEFKVLSGKKVGTVFHPNTGNVEIRFRTFPFGDDKENKGVYTLTLDSHQFFQLVHKASVIMELIYSVEDRDHPDFLVNRSPKEILGWETYPGRTYSCWGDYQMCRLEFIDYMHIDLRWNCKNKETLVRIYKGEGQMFSWKPADNAISFRAGGFELLVRNLIPKLRNSIRYWGNLHKAGKDTWPSLYSTYEPRQESFPWGKRFGWWMPVEDEDLYGDYEEREQEERERNEDIGNPWKVVEEDGRSYYAC